MREFIRDTVLSFFVVRRVVVPAVLSPCSSFAGAVVLAPFFVLFAFGLCSPESVPHRDSIGNVQATLALPAAGYVLVRESDDPKGLWRSFRVVRIMRTLLLGGGTLLKETTLLGVGV